MTSATCTPMPTVMPVSEHETRRDRFGELLECLADLRVETSRQRAEMAQTQFIDDQQVREALERLAHVEHSHSELSVEAASVHQSLAHRRAI